MADAFNPKFAKPSVLSTIQPALLIRLLKPYAKWLADCGITLRSARDLDSGMLDRLSLALIAGENLPPGLPELMALIDDMSSPSLYDRLQACAKKAKLEVGEKDAGADLAVRLYLKAPKLLEELRVEVASLRPKRVSRYLAMADKIPDPPALRTLKSRCTAMAASLKKDFLNRKRGGGTRVYPFAEPHGFRLMIRRGDTLRSQAVIDEDEETRRLILRPELYDVVRYDTRHGDLLVNARAQADIRAYCRFIGRHVFGNDFMFDGIEPPPRYTLEPIRSEGQAILTRGEFDAIEEVRLDTLELEHPELDHGGIRLGPSDVFALLPLVGGQIAPSAVLTRAKFVFRIAGEKRARSVIIIPPITAIFEHDGVGDVIELFLERRGILLPRTESLRAAPDSLFAMS
jgi:hypothetical protein